MRMFILEKNNIHEDYDKISQLLRKNNEKNQQISTNTTIISIDNKTVSLDNRITINNLNEHGYTEIYNKEINLFSSNQDDLFILNS